MRVVVLLAALLAVLGSAVLFSCSQTPANVPIRTFERAQRVDVICLRLRGDDAPAPLPQEACSPVPPDVNGADLANQLFALVTQTTRGEVAVVDLSAGILIDQSKGVPGYNFLPVGALPTDVAATPDGRMAFVASAEPNKYAIYGIPGHRILGDAAGRRDPEGATTLASWPVCALPQRPGALTVVPRRTPAVFVDGGADDGSVPPYELVAVLPGDRTASAKVVTIDPRPFLRGSPRRAADGTILDPPPPGPALVPGTLEPCPITAAIDLVGEEAVPEAIRASGAWQNGVPYVDGGIDISCSFPTKPGTCGARSCACPSPDNGDAGAPEDAGAATCVPDAGAAADDERTLALGPLDPPQPVAIARDDQTLYIADDALPLVHTVDLSTFAQPRELPPFVVSSLADPSRVVSVRDIAVSPPTRDYKRFLYAVDRKQGSIAVFDITDPATAPRAPMLRPHAELNPFQPADRIAFSAPVVSVAFARHDFPLSASVDQSTAQSGILCNPNPGAGADPGVGYRANSEADTVDLGPFRLRGIFAFATLSDGQIVAIDVDDWDAPCRRPNSLAGPTIVDGVPVVPGLLAAPQIAGPFDPYQAPQAATDSVTNEAFFPVSSPHRIRSTYYLRDDTSTGRHIPFLTSTPAIQTTGTPLPLFGEGSEGTPRIHPTAPAVGVNTGTTEVGIRFSFDVPDVHLDQDWTVVYEGALPGFEGLPATVSTTDNYSSLTLFQPQGRFCDKGVEDWNTGLDRATAVTSALQSSAKPRRLPNPPFERRMIDYVQLNEELLPADDAYWRQDDAAGADACWDPQFVASDPSRREEVARVRYETCSSVFGQVSEQNPNRDFPILEAYNDRLVVGRFGVTSPGLSREAIYSDPSNATTLRFMRCCFHNQVRFNVRASAQWVAVGSSLGVLHHIKRGPGDRCVSSCDPRDALLNGRAPALPDDPNDPIAPYRDSALALRNPAFSFFMQNGYRIVPGGARQDVVPPRDTAFRFQARGAFTPLLINLASSTTSVNPQSMRYIETLGQIAVVDGASQGLVLIDLASVAIARAPYF